MFKASKKADKRDISKSRYVCGNSNVHEVSHIPLQHVTGFYI